MTTKEKVRPFYEELQGYLSQAPGGDKIRHIDTPAVWEQYNAAVEKLSQVSERDYKRFKVRPKPTRQGNRSLLDVTEYRACLGGLINRLHAEFFSDDPPPFSGAPGMIISQSQQQSQQVHVKMVLEIQEQLIRKLLEFDEGSKERNFIEKLKGSLQSVQGVRQLLALLLTTAKDLGVSVTELLKIFT